MAGYLSNLMGALTGRPPKVSPFKEAGVSGTAIFGGYVENIEKDRRLAGAERYRTASDLLANLSIVAAGLRYFLNLTAAPRWTVEPAKDENDGAGSSDEAKKAAEFVESVLADMDTPWTRIVRRAGMYRFHGFAINEWTAKKRPDGTIGLLDIEPRPQHTIETWEVDEAGSVLGVNQRSPQNGELFWLPRGKIMYLVDDALTDSPEGMGWFRHLVEPGERLRKYLKLEGQGYERDMRGIPLGRAPITEINNMLRNGQITQAEHTRMLAGIKSFLKTQSKAEDTGILLDSATYLSQSGDGQSVSGAQKWGLELITGGSMGFQEIDKAITRLNEDMARILGVEGIMLGGGQGSGNRALGEDKSKNLYINVNGTLSDILEAAQRDVLKPLWKLNGFPEELMPTLKVEDASFKDAQAVASALSAMATAGAPLAPDDPAIDDVRDLLGISRQPQEAIDRALDSALMGQEAQQKALDAPTPTPGEGKPPSSKTPPKDGGGGNLKKGGESEVGSDGARTFPEDVVLAKFNPDQPRDPEGSSTGGQWTSGGGSATAALDPDMDKACIEIAKRLMPDGYDVADDAPNTFEDLVDRVGKTGKMVVWSGASDKTIFGSPEANYAFRAWHDICHLRGMHRFTPEGELATLKEQIADVRRFIGAGPKADRIATLLHEEIAGQLGYAKNHGGNFPVNQRAFAEAYLKDPEKAVTATFDKAGGDASWGRLRDEGKAEKPFSAAARALSAKLKADVETAIAKYSPDQPREPKGSPGGGRFRPKGETGYFEVAPGKTWLPEEQAAWERLSINAKAAISNQMVGEFVPRWASVTGIDGKLSMGLGGFGGFTNPNFNFTPSDPADMQRALNGLGTIFSQDSMMGVSATAFPGSFPAGVVRIGLPRGLTPVDVHDLYKTLKAAGLATGHSTNLGKRTMEILVTDKAGNITSDLARINHVRGGVADIIPNDYVVKSYSGHVAFPEHGVDYGTESRPLRRGRPGSPVADPEDHLRTEATARLRGYLAANIGKADRAGEQTGGIGGEP